MVTYDMSDYVRQAIEHYMSLAGITKLKKATTPFCPDGTLLPADDEIVGEVREDAASVLMKVLWAARLARPDLTRPTCKLASKGQSWTKNDDKNNNNV